MLMQKEDERYNSEKQIAETAKATLAKQRELYNQISTKAGKLGQIKDVKFYKEQYGELAKKYQDALKELEGQMKEQESIINRFQQLQAVKEGK